MWVTACIVCRQSGVQVVGDTRIEMLSGKALKNVDIFHDSHLPLSDIPAYQTIGLVGIPAFVEASAFAEASARRAGARARDEALREGPPALTLRRDSLRPLSDIRAYQTIRLVGMPSRSPLAEGEGWWAVQDSNLRPPACEAGALTN